jgi:hypothetical protein
MNDESIDEQFQKSISLFFKKTYPKNVFRPRIANACLLVLPAISAL